MEEIGNSIHTWLTSTTGAALIIGLTLFVITLVMTSLRWIGFSITFLLLLFTLVTAFAVANLDVIRTCIQSPSLEHSANVDVKIAGFQEQILKSVDSLKAEVEIQKHKVQVLTEELEALKKAIPKNETHPAT